MSPAHFRCAIPLGSTTVIVTKHLMYVHHDYYVTYVCNQKFQTYLDSPSCFLYPRSGMPEIATIFSQSCAVNNLFFGHLNTSNGTGKL